MENLDEAVQSFDFAFFGAGKHQVAPEVFLTTPGAILVDLRAEQEQSLLPLGHLLPEALHLPFHQLPQRWQEIPAEGPVGLFCSSDTRSAMALLYLRAQGRTNARMVKGGYTGLVEELKPGKVYKRSA